MIILRTFAQTMIIVKSFYLIVLQMVIRIAKIFSLSLLLAVLLAACHTREVAYLSDAQRDSIQEIMTVYTATILPGDQLYIHVASKTPESVLPFNQESHSYATEVTQENMGQQTRYINTEVTGYTVSERGTIPFPVLGTIEVVGITYDSLSHYLEKRLRDEGYVLDPQVQVKILNFRVTVVGEVRTPKQIHADGTRLTIFEALAICGDITDYGQRTNITVVRQDGGKREIGEIDLTKREMLESPYYYLHNNDIVYVEPNRRRKVDSDRNPDIPKYISIGVSAVSIIRTNIRTAQRLNRMD